MKRNLNYYKVILILTGIFIAPNLIAQKVIYVNSANSVGANDGNSWGSAFKDLQKALDVAGSNDAIWVAQGTYFPTEIVDGADSLDKRNRSFHAAGKNITIYGGFNGSEIILEQRKIELYPTVFSGDFNKDDSIVGSGETLALYKNTENSYHVFVLSEVRESRFNGVTISGGNSAGVGNYFYNGITIFTIYGGGILSLGNKETSSITLEKCVVSFNNATNGGGIYSNSGTNYSSVTLDESTVSYNKAEYGGGVFSYSLNSSSIIYCNKSTVVYNRAGFGGGLNSNSYTTGSSTVKINKSTLAYNSASYGGAVFSNCYGSSSSKIEIDKSTIVSNKSIAAGAIYSSSTSSTSEIIVKSSIVHNLSNFYKSPNGLVSSQGYNIFSDNSAGTAAIGDKINVQAPTLNLLTLTYNGGSTQTMLPGKNSVALNNGNSSDTTSAQNRKIIDGFRDIGAAEYNCSVNVIDKKRICQKYFTWKNGNKYTSNNSSAKYLVLSETTGICDTSYTLDLTFNIVNTAITQVNWITLMAKSANSSYQWIDCDNSNKVITGETNQYFIATSNGNYAVIVTENGCTDTSECLNINSVGMEDLNVKLAVTVYPNPTKDLVNISLNHTPGQGWSISMYNLLGKEIHKQEISDIITSIDLSNIKSGIYFIEISSLNDGVIKKIIVE